jgi:hypothetical protein
MDEYIKMVLALPEEFFKDWEWKEGDHLLHKELGSDQWYERTIGELEVSRNTILYKVVDYHDELEGEIRPLPSQRQLQELSTLDWWTFYSAIVHSSDIDYEKNESCECGCLKETVWILYGKKWDGTKWI